jgi:hypothetical protein
MRAGHGNDLVVLPDNAPPLVVFATVALGGLRGIVIDMLWNRLEHLRYEGDYVEIVQLADWVTKLEPRLAETWDYHSFNIAYNISAMFRDPNERWRWVSAGISMLRDEALVYNPKSLVLYDRLCRMYKHKLMDRSDAAREYYRLLWATEMAELLGGPRPDYRKIAATPGLSSRFIEEYRLDPALMQQVDTQYGPFDWILPEPHIIYWARAGIQSTGKDADKEFDRLICLAMISTFFEGQILHFSAADGVLETGVRVDILPRTVAALRSLLRKYDAEMDQESVLFRMYVGFLRHAIVLLHDRGNETAARELFVLLRETLDDKDKTKSFEEYLVLLKTPRDPGAQAQEQRAHPPDEHNHDH